MTLKYRRRAYSTAAELIAELRDFYVTDALGNQWTESFRTQARSSGWLTVIDWTALAGAIITITDGAGGTYTLTEGGGGPTDWTAAVSNAATATSIGAAVAALAEYNAADSVLVVSETVYVHYNTPLAAANDTWTSTAASTDMLLSGAGFLEGGADEASLTDLWVQTTNGYSLYFKYQANQVMLAPTWPNGQPEVPPITPVYGNDDAWNAGILPNYTPFPGSDEESSSGIPADTNGIALLSMFAEDDVALLTVISEGASFIAYGGVYTSWASGPPGDQLPVAGLNNGMGAFPSTLAKVMSGVQGAAMEGSLWMEQGSEFDLMARGIEVHPAQTASIPVSAKTAPPEAFIFPIWMAIHRAGMSDAIGLQNVLRASDGLPISMVADGTDVQQHVVANLLDVGGDSYYIFEHGLGNLGANVDIGSLSGRVTLDTTKRIALGPLDPGGDI